MKSIITLDKANQPYGFAQLNGSGSLDSNIINNTKYKVYVALLTQTGGSNPSSTNITGDPIIIGQTYQIIDNGGHGWDFTNIGAPNNDIGTYFVATGTTPANWGVDAQLDYNTGAPVVTVLENTIGNIWHSWENIGLYGINSDSLFTSNKTIILCTPSVDPSTPKWLTTQQVNSHQLYFTQFDTAGSTYNGIINPATIEIRVYN